MLKVFFSNFFKNIKILSLIILTGLIISFYTFENIKVGYQSKVKYQMTYVKKMKEFQYTPLLVFEVGAHSIYLIEKMHRLMILNKIKIPNECYTGSRFDDSNEYAKERNRLGFNPGYNFQVSRIDKVLTITYNSDKSNTEMCIQEFIKSFNSYQEELYYEFLGLFEKLSENQVYGISFISKIEKKYNLNHYYKERNKKRLSEESKKELIDLGLDLELVDAYFRYKDEITDLNKNTETYYKKIDGTIIGNIENKSLKPKKINCFIYN